MTTGASGLLTPVFDSYLLGASALAAMSLGALLYTVAGQGEWTMEGARAPTSVDRGPEHLIAGSRQEMKLTQ